MKVCYFNDAKQDVMVRVLGDSDNPTYTLHPKLTYKVYSFKAPESAIPYIKSWGDIVLISYIDDYFDKQ